MDATHSLFAPLRGLAPRRVALALAASALALALSGCDGQRVDKLEERVKLVEAKADAADKRARTAEAIVSETQTISQPDPAPQTDLDAASDDNADQSVDVGGDPDVVPPPMADNGKG
ncbi:MAG: hypothetical protein ACKVOL_07865 [Novosphingobium sp.]